MGIIIAELFLRVGRGIMGEMGSRRQRLAAAMRHRIRGLVWGLSRAPDRRGWVESAALAVALTVVAVPLALAGGLVGGAAPASAGTLRTLVVPFIAPGLLEECLFRGLLLPYPRAAGSTWRSRSPWWLGSLLAYLAAHPLTAALVRPSARGVFDTPVFLAEALLLGVTATLLYERTGSLWPAILVHGAVVAAWLQLGGAGLLGL